VQPTMQMKDGVPVNDDAGLEREADVMGGKALQCASSAPPTPWPLNSTRILQRKPYLQASTGAGDFWYDEADPKLRMFRSYEECVEANQEFNPEADQESDQEESNPEIPAETRFDQYRKDRRAKREKLVHDLAELRETMQTPDEVYHKFEDHKSRAGQNRERRHEFTGYVDAFKEWYAKYEKAYDKMKKIVEIADEEYYLLRDDELRWAKTIARINSNIEQLQEEMNQFEFDFVQLIPKKKEVIPTDSDAIAVRGEFGVITVKAYKSIPAPYDDLGLLTRYLSTMARAHGQPGIHRRTNDEVVLKFLGKLGDSGILASGKSEGRYLFEDKLSGRH
jgi:hypothetical protein